MQRLLTFELRNPVFAIVTAAAWFAVNAANAQPTPAGGPPPAPQAGSFSEDFDAGPLKGWEFSCQQSLIATQDGQALQASGGGHAIWTSAGSVSDFVLQFRFGYQQGIGDVIFRMTETQAGMECYCLMLQPQGLVLVRRLHTPDGQFPEQQLAAVEGALPAGQWHEFTVQAVGGQIDVAIGDQKVLSYRDPTPLTSGMCGLGVIANSGAVLYDDASLVELASAAGEASPSPTAPAVNWP
jgi:hypothetical protein